MVRTGNVDFSCKTLTSIEIRKSKYHIIRRVRFRWGPPPPPPRERYLDPRLNKVTSLQLFHATLAYQFVAYCYRPKTLFVQV